MPPLVTIRALPLPTGGAQRVGQQALVVPEAGLVCAVRVRGIEHRDAGAGGGQDRVERELLIGRQAHAAEADPQLGGVKPRQQATQLDPTLSRPEKAWLA